MAEHLPLKLRKPLCGRARILEALSSLRGGLGPATSPYQFGKLQDDLVDLVTSEADKQSTSDYQESMEGELDKFVGGLIPVIIPKINSFAHGISEAVLSRIRAEIERQLSAVSCQLCAGTSLVCRGCGVADDPIVDRGGACLHPFKDQFTYIRALVLKYYQKYSAASASLTNVEIVLSTKQYNEKSPFACCPHASAGTFYQDIAGRRLTEVRLSLSPDSIDQMTFLAIPYLLFHELVCHAWQGVDTSVQKSRTEIAHTRSDDRFAEGWMDAVAWHLFERAIHKHTSYAAYIREEHEQFGRHVHESRGASLPPPGLYMEKKHQEYDAEHYRREQIRSGTRTAREFLGFLGRELPSYDAEAAWLSISFGLNLRAGISRERGEFVRLVDSVLTKKEGEAEREGEAARQRLAEASSNYLRSKDLTLFLKEMLGDLCRAPGFRPN